MSTTAQQVAAKILGGFRMIYAVELKKNITDNRAAKTLLIAANSYADVEKAFGIWKNTNVGSWYIAHITLNAELDSENEHGVVFELENI